MKSDAKPSGGVAGGDVDKGGSEGVGGVWEGGTTSTAPRAALVGEGGEDDCGGAWFSKEVGGEQKTVEEEEEEESEDLILKAYWLCAQEVRVCVFVCIYVYVYK